MKEAIKLAADQKAKLCFAYVADEHVPVGEGVAIDFKKHDATVRKEGKALLEKVLRIAQTEKVSVESHLIEIIEPGNHISQAIVDYAAKWRADLIVIGTRGHRGLKRFLLGSVADELIQKTSVPVHLVRRNTSIKKKTAKK